MLPIHGFFIMDDANVNAHIMRVLTDAAGPLPLSSIIRAIPMTSRSGVRNALRALADTGAIDRPKHGYYSLPRHTPLAEDAATSYPSVPPGLVMIPLATFRASAGPGSDVMDTEFDSYCAMDRATLRQMTAVDPGRLLIIVAAGTSMVPTIFPGDRLLVSRLVDEPLISHAIYVWRSRYAGMVVKRAVLLEDGAVALQGDAELQPAGRIYPFDDDPPWVAVGRVHQVMKAL